MLRNRSAQAVIYTYGVTLFFAVFFALPILWLLSSVFKNQLEMFQSPPVIFVKPKLTNFVEVLSSATFLRALKNSVVTACGTVVCTIVVAVPAAFGLSRLKGRLKTNVLTWLLLTRAAPGMIYIIPYFILYSRIGLIDTTPGLILIYLVFTVPLMTWLLLSFFEDIPVSLLEAATCDGATSFQVFTRIALPLIRAGLTSSAILVFIFSWNEFVFALVITRRIATTAPVAMVNFMGYAGTDWGMVASSAVLILLPVLVFSVVIRKYLVRGMTSGAVKE